MSDFELAQLNVALMKEPPTAHGMSDFFANLERINALAETAPGFVWRLHSDKGDATAIRPMGEDTFVNLSVWRDAESLRRYVYETAHVEIMRRRQEWFERMHVAYFVVWWVPKGHRPSPFEAIARLQMLRSQGPTPDAFTLRDAFLPPDEAPGGASALLGRACPAN